MLLNLITSKNCSDLASLQRKEKQTIVAADNKNKGTKIFCKVNGLLKILVLQRQKTAFIL
ncbi:hypothetical protein CTI16_11105 [Prevotella intermedia]|uniref:Uncharacterized protein n=1 Tax=Prevotella intermedia TaxID=28131 RepID=A0AAJ3RGV0_PREIN|nr:hypothetical protein CTI16_11105 [Prevotella intermedia]